MACATGKSAPPPTPCITLDTIIISRDVDIPHNSDAPVKIKMHAIKNCFLPKNLENQSTEGTTIPLAIR
ncbi:unknown [Clostridium sp. CAG:306]|nr:unknown [Clostridium sp. CAG:306]